MTTFDEFRQQWESVNGKMYGPVLLQGFKDFWNQALEEAALIAEDANTLDIAEAIRTKKTE